MKDTEHTIKEFYPLNTMIVPETADALSIPIFLKTGEGTKPFYRVGTALLETGELATVFANGVANYKIFTERDWTMKKFAREVVVDHIFKREEK